MAKRGHSPDYPFIGLKEAVDRCRRLYKETQGHPVGREDVGKGIGFNSMHGQAMSTVASMRKYGLLTKVGDLMQVSELAKRILFPHSDQESKAALAEAALMPPLFNQLFQEMGTSLPSEGVLTNHLVRKGFLLDAAKKAITSYQETLPYIQNADLVTRESEEYFAASEEVDAPTSTEGGMTTAENTAERNSARSFARSADTRASIPPVAFSAMQGERRVFEYDFDGEGSVGIVMSGNVETEAALDAIAAWIDLKRKDVVRKSQKAFVRSLEGSLAIYAGPSEKNVDCIVVRVNGNLRDMGRTEWEALPPYSGPFPIRQT